MALPKNTKLVSALSFANKNTTVAAEIDSKDYLNLYPKVGVETGYTEAIVNSDFKYSIAAEASNTFSIIDKDSKHVLYYVATSPTGYQSVFKAYRYGMSGNFIFEPEPITFTFLGPNERVHWFYNVGTNFVVAQLVSTQAPIVQTRVITVKTGGSSISTDWTFAYDVTAITSSPTLQCNIALVQDATGDYILRARGTNTLTLDVFDSSLNLLRSQVVLNTQTDVDYTDRTINGKTGLTYLSLTYMAYGRIPGFTWNPSTESFHIRQSSYNVLNNANGTKSGLSCTICTSWKVPRSWITSGEGSPENLIPLKAEGFRYRGYPDTTWNTPTGGMSTSDSGASNCTTTDEYTGDIHMVSRATWGTVSLGSGRVIKNNNNEPLKSFSSSIAYPGDISFNASVPDGSPYAKGFNVRNTFFVGNKIYTHGKSVTNAHQPLLLSFSTSNFLSVVSPDDTLYFDPTSIVKNPFSAAAAPANGDFGNKFQTVVRAGVGRHFLYAAGKAILEAYEQGATIAWKALATVFPSIPASVGGVSTSSNGAYGWNADTVNPVFYAVVKSSTYYCIIKHEAGAWSLAASDLAKAQVDGGNVNRGDSLYSGSFTSDNRLFTEDGLYLFPIAVPHTGGQGLYTVVYNTINGWSGVFDPSFQFKPPANTVIGDNYSDAHASFPTGYGYSDVFGYFSLRTPMDYSSFRILCSKDPRGIGQPLTESEWYTGSKPRYQIIASASSSVGLIAYLSEYPVFIGGYYTNIPQTEVSLQPNADNFIFALKSNTSRSAVEIQVSTTKLSNTFNRICLAKVTTSADKVTSSIVYSVDGIGLPEQESKEGFYLSTNGKNVYWRSIDDIASVILSGDNAIGSAVRLLQSKVAALEQKVRDLQAQ